MLIVLVIPGVISNTAWALAIDSSGLVVLQLIIVISVVA